MNQDNRNLNTNIMNHLLNNNQSNLNMNSLNQNFNQINPGYGQSMNMNNINPNSNMNFLNQNLNQINSNFIQNMNMNNLNPNLNMNLSNLSKHNNDQIIQNNNMNQNLDMNNFNLMPMGGSCIKNITFLYLNIRKNVNIPFYMTKKELYNKAFEIYQKIDYNPYYKFLLFHNKKVLDIEENSIEDISTGDLIYIETDFYYNKLMKKHENSNKMNIEFIKYTGFRRNCIFPNDISVKEMIKSFLSLMPKYKNENIRFKYNTGCLNLEESTTLNKFFKNNSSPKIYYE